jgi:hypothetical protein
MADPAELEAKAAAKADALAQSSQAKEELLNNNSSLSTNNFGAGYSPLEMPSSAGYSPLTVEETTTPAPLSPNQPIRSKIAKPDQPVEKVSEDIWKNLDGSYTYYDADGTEFKAANLEGLQSRIKEASRYQLDKDKSSNPVIDTAKGVAETAVNLGIDIGKGFVYASPTGLEEYLNSYNLKNNDTTGSEFYDAEANPIKDVKGLATKYAEVTQAQLEGKPLSDDQQAFLESTEFKIADEGRKVVDETYNTLANMDKAKVDWSRKLDNLYHQKAYKVISESDGTWAAITDTFDNPGYFIQTGVESVPYMVALTIGGPVTQTAMLTTIARGNAANNTQEFRKINGRDPTAEEQFYIDAYSAVSTVAEKYADQFLLGKLKLGNKVTGNLTDKLPSSLQWLGTKALAIGGEGVSGATTETLDQLAVHGKIVDPTAIEYGAVNEALSSPSGAGTIIAGNVAKDVIVDQVTKERFTKGNIDQKIADNNAALDEVAVPLTDSQREQKQQQLERRQAWVADEANAANTQRIENYNKDITRLERELALGRWIPLNEDGTIEAQTLELLQRADLLENNKARIEEGGLVGKLKDVGTKAAEAVKPETQQAEAVAAAVDTSAEYVPNSAEATPTAESEVVLDPKAEGYNPLDAIEALAAKLDQVTAGTTEAENLLADLNQQLEIAGNYAFGDQITEEAQKPAIQRITAVANKINNFVPTEEVDTKKEEDGFLDLTTPLDQVSKETKNSMDPNDIVEPMSQEEAQALAQEYLDSVAAESQATGQDVSIPSNRDGTAGVEATPGNIPAPSTTTVTENFLSNPDYKVDQANTGRRRPGLAQIVEDIKSADTVNKLNYRINYLNNFAKKHVAKLKVYRDAQQAFVDTQQPQTIYETTSGYVFLPASAPQPANVIKKGNKFNVTNIGGITKVVGQINREANAAINAVERAKVYQPKRAAQLNRRAANAIAERTGVESVDQRAARQTAANTPTPDQVDRGDAATPAPAEQSGAAINPIATAIASILEAVQTGKITQAEATPAINALVGSQVPAQTETTTPAAPEAATVDQQAEAAQPAAQAETAPQEAPQTPETATPAEAETTAAPVQDEQATTPEENVIESTPINTKAAFIAKYSQYIQEGTKKLVPFNELPAEVLQEMAADIGACK